MDVTTTEIKAKWCWVESALYSNKGNMNEIITALAVIRDENYFDYDKREWVG